MSLAKSYFDEGDKSFSRRSWFRISPSVKRPTSLTPSLVFSKRKRAGTLLTFHSVLKAFLGSFHLYTQCYHTAPYLEMIQRSYSGFCPTSTKAACGLLAPVKVDSSVGSAATTSGHHGLLVCGSLEARKAMKKASAAAGIARSPMAFGKAKSRMIGIVLGEARSCEARY